MPELVPPAEVALLRVNEAAGDVVLTWDDVTTDLTGSPESAVTYNVYSDPSPDTGVTTLLAVAPAATYSHVGAFDDSGDHFYLASAVDENANEGNRRPPRVSAPSITSIGFDAGAVTLSWTAAEPQSELDGYTVLWGTTSLSYDQRTDLGGVTTANLSPVSTGETYYFAVFARDLGVNLSEFSGESSIDLQSGGANPPGITASVSPSPNVHGWNNTDVTVSFTCSTGATCPDPTTATMEGADQVVMATATDGSDTTSVTVLVSIDKTDPTVGSSASPGPNAAGWNNSDVAVTFTCDDDRSGIASCTLPTGVNAEGIDQEIIGTATDLAGNTGIDSTLVSIDKTPPTITPSLAPAPNAAGWNNADTTVSFACDDTLSGVDTCTGPTVVDTEGVDQEIVGSAVDLAGNAASDSG
ncbi:MAG: hypothetical protein GY708_25815, partial [Actinomycetia bacterium]|nr:hypothetical protein [Actinomycetes bacterium]